MATKYIQKAIQTPDGTYLCVTRPGLVTSYTDSITGKTYELHWILNRSELADSVEKHLTMDDSLNKIKSNMLWKCKTVDGFEFRPLCDLETDHLVSISSMKDVSSLIKYIIGVLLEERNYIGRIHKPKKFN